MKCTQCQKEFSRPADVKRHMKEAHGEVTFYDCDKCDYKAKRPSDLKRHNRLKHESVPYRPQKVQMPQPQPRGQKSYEAEEQTALKTRFKSYRVKTTEADPMTFLNNMIPQIDYYVAERLQDVTGLKLQLKLSIQFWKPNDLATEKDKPREFYSRQLPIFRGSDFDITGVFPRIMEQIEKHQRNGSGFVIHHIIHMDIHLLKYMPLRGSTFVELPKELKGKAAIINIKNKDEKCFMWSVLAALHPTIGDHVNPNRVSNYRQYEEELDFTGIEFPVQYKDLKKFEEQNGLAVNVYGYEKELHVLRVSKVMDRQQVHLLLYEGHYSLIKDLNRLLHDQTKHKERKFFCPRCLIPKTTPEILEQHLEQCSTQEPTRVKMPENTELKFKNIHKKLRQPLVVYADFECLTKSIKDQHGKTERYQHHVPCGYGLVEALGCCDETKFSEPTIYRGDKVVEKLLIDLQGIANEHQNRINNSVPLDPNLPSDGDICHICKGQIKENKVRDHCHVCGKFRGVTHNKCNIGYRLNRDIVVVFHNLRKYDGHIIMQQIGEVAKVLGLEIGVIGKAMEDYISFNLKHKKEGPGDQSYSIKFIDSVQFLNLSLDGLVSNLEGDKFKALETQFSGERLDALKRKGVYPYDYMDSEKRFQETLPPIEAFYSKLNEGGIRQEDYNHAQRVWKLWNFSNMGQYHDLYLETDVLLLADVFEEFRRLALEKYELDPCHYVTTPSLTWDACLYKTGITLELFEDPDMYLFCERGIRGGISQISHRLAKANNPLVPGFNCEDPISWIIYLDANNLYGYAMSQKLPVDGFKWMSEEEIKATDFNNVDGDLGYILEVDLEYPQEYHDKHNDYPLAPEAMEINDISPYCQQLKKDLGLKLPPQVKLVPNLNHKTKYVLHCRSLKLYLELGMVRGKIHRVLKFNQRAWLAEYIDMNTQMRAKAKNAFEKDFFKLMNNAVFGKTMENVRRYRDIELVNQEMRLEKLVANPRFQDSCRFNEDLVGVSMAKASCSLCKPIYIGLSVLDLSKELMYRFHYQYIVPKYGSKAKLLFTDTDSLCYHIETPDIYRDLREDKHLFDFSEYPQNHPNFDITNKKVIGKMKDETASLPIAEFCGLRPKMYSVKGEGINKKTAKGIKKGVVKQIPHEDYVRTLLQKQPMEHQMNIIRNHLHQMYSETLTKTSLSPYDDKRWLLPDGIASRAHGHFMNDIEDMDTNT